MVSSAFNEWFARLLLFLFVASLLANTANAQTKLDRFYPPVVQRGTESTIAGEGTLKPWPMTAICDRDDIKVTCDKDAGKLKVTVADDAPPGVAWVRLRNDKSASGLVPLIISSAVTTIEAEPNNKIAESKTLTLPTIIAGKLQKSGDIDSYRVDLKSGQRLIASVTANQVLGSPMDAVLQLTDLRGNVLFQSEDVRGVDPQIVYEAKADEILVLRIFAFPLIPTGSVRYAGAATFVYTIDMTTEVFVDHAFPLDGSTAVFGYNLPKEPQIRMTASTSISPSIAYVDDALGWSWLSTAAAKTTVIASTNADIDALPIVAFGHISEPKEIQRFRFTATKGTKYRAEVHSKSNGFLLDSKLTIVDTQSDKQLASNDDVSRGGYDAGVDFTAKENGEIEVQLSDLVGGFGPRHAYELHIRKAKLTCLPTVTADHFEIDAKKDANLEIPITLNRQRGFNEKISITATGLPDGVTVTAVVSESKGDSAKTVKLKLSAKSATSGLFQIAGTILDKDGKPTDETIDVVSKLRPTISLKSFWLTVQ